MANFEPQWELRSTKNVITQDGNVMIEVRMSSYRPDLPYTDLIIEDNQYIEFNLNVSGTGDTLKEGDFVVYIGEDKNNLEKINDVDTGIKTTYGKHKIKLKSTEWHLQSPTSTVTAFYIKLERPKNGVWDSGTSISFEISHPMLITIIDNQVAGNYSVGELNNSLVSINYDSSTEFWVTPELTVYGNKKYTIGAIGYGADSRLFAQAFGRSRRYDPKLDTGTDKSNRVFIPTYDLQPITLNDIPSEHITGKGNIFVPQGDNKHSEEYDIYTLDSANSLMKSGLKFNINGQVLQPYLVQGLPCDVYMKYKITSLKSHYENEYSAYYIGKRFKAYQMWIAPNDTSKFLKKPIPNHLYMLRDTKVYPYTVKSVMDGIEEKILFEPEVWLDMGYYDERLGDKIIGSERMFRILSNTKDGEDIVFETDENLGQVHVGEYFGHTVYPIIKANGSDLITYHVNQDTSPHDITKYNIRLSPNGMLYGTVFATGIDFDVNDEIELQFDVVATAKTGSQSTKRYRITIVRGFSENYLTANLKPSVSLERKWFDMISTEIFSDALLYRESDDRYGLHKVPKILVKENLVDPSFEWIDLRTIKRKIRKGIINTSTGSSVPERAFDIVMGNYKIRSATDDNGNILYDILYREVLPAGTQVQPSNNPRKYTDVKILDIFGLRQNLYQVLGEDVKNLLTDPDDMRNRAMTVKGISGINTDMIDTLPRYLVHPHEEGNIVPDYIPMIPVAFLQPGYGDVIFNKLLLSGEYKIDVNQVYKISSVEFMKFSTEYGKYVHDSFTINLVDTKIL